MRVKVDRKKKQSGQAILEYVLLLTIVFGAVGYFLHQLTHGLDVTTAKYGGTVEKQLRTGAAPASVWNK
jgi:hypothetical protein